MKKWIVVVAVLICLGLYAMVKFSMSQDQDMSNQVEETKNTEQINAGNKTGNSNKTTPSEESEPAVPAAQVEAIVKVYDEFKTALMNKDYEKAWKHTSQYFRQRQSGGMLVNFKEEMSARGAELAKAIIHPESAINIDGLIGFLYTAPSFPVDLYLFFIQEEGQWKLYIGKRADSVDTLKK